MNFTQRHQLQINSLKMGSMNLRDGEHVTHSRLQDKGQLFFHEKYPTFLQLPDG